MHNGFFFLATHFFVKRIIGANIALFLLSLINHYVAKYLIGMYHPAPPPKNYCFLGEVVWSVQIVTETLRNYGPSEICRRQTPFVYLNRKRWIATLRDWQLGFAKNVASSKM